MKEYSKKSCTKEKKIIFIIFIVLIILNLATKEIQATEVQSNYFTETIEAFNNPDMGIYRPTVLYCKAEGEWSDTKIQYADGLVHLRIGIKEFSKAGNGNMDYNITQEHIDKLNSYLDQVRQAGGTAIVRFAYDDFAGIEDLEPDIEQILVHIEQLKPFFEANEDIIACVEGGFLGPWGEQHSSEIVTEENIAKITKKLLEVVPKSRTVSVRKPLWYCATTGADIDEIDKDVSVSGTYAYRIGMFNDGYLGSATDLGSFKDRAHREKALVWLNNQATHTIYGGEVSWGNNEVDKNGYLFHAIEHIQEEMFQTHTSYINEEWNKNVLNEWRADRYCGEEELYYNSNAYDYVKNHLGYRFVLTETKIPKTIKEDENAVINIKLKNIGAANVVNEKSTYIVLKKCENIYYIPTNLDVRTWASRENQDLNLNITVDDTVEAGNYEVFLKIINKQDDTSTNKRAIRFANEDVWNEEIGANKIGNIEVIKLEKEINDSIASSKYVIDNNVVSRILPNTTVREFKENVETQSELTFIDKNGHILDDNSIIATGTELRVGTSLDYELCVRGDIDCDGIITINDFSRIKLHCISKINLTGIQLEAAKLDENNEVNINDVVLLKLILISD